MTRNRTATSRRSVARRDSPTESPGKPNIPPQVTATAAPPAQALPIHEKDDATRLAQAVAEAPAEHRGQVPLDVPAGTAATPDVVVQITLVCGGIINVRTPVVICARYDGLPLAGGTKAFDRALDSWLTRAIDLGMVGSGLGQLFPINLEKRQQEGRSNAGTLLLASMGEPGGFAPDDLRFLMSNVTVAVKSLGHDQFATTLIGTRRNEITIGNAIRGFMEGILDGYERFRAIAHVVTDNRERFSRAMEGPLFVSIVDPSAEKIDEVQKAFDAIAGEGALPGLKLRVVRGDDVAPDLSADPGAVDTEPDVPVTLLRVTRHKAGPIAAATGSMESAFKAEVFQFSALSDAAAVPVREEEVNAYLIRELPDRMIKSTSPKERDDYARLFANVLVPEDFRKLTEGARNLTLEVDETTAIYPWEMIAHKKYSRTAYLGVDGTISRQFRSLLSPPPSSPPPLNTVLRVLVIADPAAGDLSLPQAREEGVSVVDVLHRARLAWRGAYDLRATVRIGPRSDQGVGPMLDQQRLRGSWVESAEPCDPLELAMLIVNEQYDVIHYAGHGLFEKETGRAGWVFARDCFLSASEIFRVRQVPRLVFANACFSAATSDRNEQRGHLVGLAQALFARGIPNFIGTGWQVDDAAARQCARWFYARVLGLVSPDETDGVIGTSPPATIGEALREARRSTLQFKAQSSSWGAYQHYGRVSDKLLPLPNRPAGDDRTASVDLATSNDGQGAKILSLPSSAGGAVHMATSTRPAEASPAAANPNLVYVNGIDLESGQYAFAPRSIEDLAKQVLVRPGVANFEAMHTDTPRSFGVPFGMDPTKLEEAGWGIVFHEDIPPDVRAALQPLIDWRGTQAGDRLKVLDYKKGEDTRSWYQRHRISAGNVDPEIIPYYLLLIGSPGLIPFDFQYLVGVEYAVGRLDFDTAAEYERYARSIVAYESSRTLPNAKQIAYWGTRHLGDPATELSASLLIDPLANGIAGAAGALKRPIHADVGYERVLRVADDATKEALLATLHAAKPPAMLFTASHGMAVRSGRPEQLPTQGALLCQDWPGFGFARSEHFLAASDIADDANVNGMVALLFACFGNGTPDLDQFPKDFSQTDKAQPLAPQPFIAALPRRLLAHPNGGALAVIGHIDRAWSLSIQAPKVSDAQIGTFRSSLGFILSGAPVGHAMCGQFGARFAALSTALASSTSPTAPTTMQLSDRDLVTFWLQRNDAQNYVMLGDPAVRIRRDTFS